MVVLHLLGTPTPGWRGIPHGTTAAMTQHVCAGSDLAVQGGSVAAAGALYDMLHVAWAI